MRDSDLFVVIPQGLITHGGLAVYAALASFAHRDTGEAWPSKTRLAEVAGVTDNTLDKWLRVLAEDGWIAVVPRFSDGGRQTSNLYRVYARPTIDQAPPQGRPPHVPPKDGGPRPPQGLGPELEPEEPEPEEPASPTARGASPSTADLVLVAPEAPADQVKRVMAEYKRWRMDFAGCGAATRRTLAGLTNGVRDALAAGVPEDVVKQGLADWTHHGHVAASLDSFIENRSRGRAPGQQIPKQSKIRATLTEAAQGPDPAMRALFGLDPVNAQAGADIVGRALPPTFGAMP